MSLKFNRCKMRIKNSANKITKHSSDFNTSIALTKRELECLNLITQGLTIKKIAAYLNLSIETVHSHAKAIRFKTNSTSITQAVVKAFRLGLVD